MFPFSLGAAQTTPVRGDVAANVAQHIRLVRVAARAHVRVLVFPELSLTGYELDLADDLAFSHDDARLLPLLDAASSRRTTLIVGAPVRIASQLYIGAFIIFPDRTVDVYTKHHLGAFSPSDNPNGSVPPPEASVFRPGTQNPLVSLGDHQAAVAVCADCNRPSHARQAADLGAKAYLAGAFTIPIHLETMIDNLRTYAVRHSMAVVFANYGGTTGGLAAAGRSAIWSDTGEPLAELEAIGAGVAIAIREPERCRVQTVMID
jgi:predicted amidohydrolase